MTSEGPVTVGFASICLSFYDKKQILLLLAPHPTPPLTPFLCYMKQMLLLLCPSFCYVKQMSPLLWPSFCHTGQVWLLVCPCKAGNMKLILLPFRHQCSQVCQVVRWSKLIHTQSPPATPVAPIDLPAFPSLRPITKKPICGHKPDESHALTPWKS